MAASSGDFLTTSLSKQRVLVLGDGNFSFSLSLAHYFVYYGSDTSLVLTSFDSSEKLKQDEFASENLKKLAKMKNIVVLHDIDATNLSQHFPSQKFGRIIFNFPHTGGKSNIKKCRKLLEDFFCSAVKHLEQCGGDICVTLCKGQGGTPQDQPYRSHGNSWQIVNNAAKAGLLLHQLLPFVTSDYCYYKSVGYRSKLKNGFNTSGGLIHVFIPGVKVDPVQDFRDKGPSVILDHILEQVSQLKVKALYDVPGHPLHFLKEEIQDKLADLADQLEISFETMDGGENFNEADHLAYDFSTTRSCADQRCLRNTTSPNQNVLTAFKNYESFVFCDSSLTIQDEISPTSNIVSNNLIIGRLFAKDKVGSFLKAEEELQIVLDGLKTLLPVDNDCELYQQNYLEEVVIDSKWTNSSEVAHLARRKCHLNTKETDGECSLPNQSNIVCNCHELRQRYLGKDARFNSQQLSFSGLVMPQTLQVSKTSSTVVFVSGHVVPDVLDMGTSMYGWLIKVDLGAVAMLRYNISDIRLLWSSTVTVKTEQLGAVTSKMGIPKFIPRPLSLFPPSYVHDISFWVSDDVSQELFMLVVIGLTKDCVKEIKLAEIYHDEVQHWLSFNYRMVYSRADGPLSHLEAVEFQNSLRRALLVLKFGLK